MLTHRVPCMFTTLVFDLRKYTANRSTCKITCIQLLRKHMYMFTSVFSTSNKLCEESDLSTTKGAEGAATSGAGACYEAARCSA